MARPARLLPLLLLFPRASSYVPAELAEFSACASSGFATSFAELRPFLQRIDLGASPYGKTSSAPLFLPLFASRNLGAGGVADASLTTAVIFLHGLSADAQTYFCTGSVAAAGHNALVVVPWFGDEQVNASFWARNSTGATQTRRRADAARGSSGSATEAWSAYWTTSRWLTGGNISPGVTGAAQYTTAFDVLDTLIRNITTSGLFPALKLLSVIGFSAGSQLTNHYSFASAVGSDAAVSGGVPVRFFVSDPGSFLYLSPERPAPVCRPLVDTGVSPAPCASFIVPPEASDPALNCSTYDVYKYGMASGLDYLNAYLAPLEGNASLKAAAVARFATKDVAYIFGAADSCNCNAPLYRNDPGVCFPLNGSLTCLPDAFGGPGCCDTWPDATTDNAMDATCPGMVQGSNRLQRGLLYVQHLNAVFPGRAPPFAASTVPGMGHDNQALYRSPQFLAAAFWSPSGGGGEDAVPQATVIGLAVSGGAVSAMLLVVAGVVVARQWRRGPGGAADGLRSSRPLLELE